MSALIDALKYLYEDFILRDLVAIVTPGALVVGTVIFLQFYDQLNLVLAKLKEIPPMLYIPVYGLLFMLGYALESFGEKVGLTPWHNRGRGPEGDKDHLRVSARLQEISGDTGDRARRERERFAVKKYMCGNDAVALIFVAVILVGWLLGRVRHDGGIFYVTLAALSVIVFVSLVWGERSLRQRVGEWEDAIVPQKGTHHC